VEREGEKYGRRLSNTLSELGFKKRDSLKVLGGGKQLGSPFIGLKPGRKDAILKNLALGNCRQEEEGCVHPISEELRGAGWGKAEGDFDGGENKRRGEKGTLTKGERGGTNSTSKKYYALSSSKRAKRAERLEGGLTQRFLVANGKGDTAERKFRKDRQTFRTLHTSSQKRVQIAPNNSAGILSRGGGGQQGP